MVDYSKWKDIEISDDEDEVHPNVDTPSLFRWRHQARVQHMEDMRREQDELALKKENVRKLSETKKTSEVDSTNIDIESLTKALGELENEQKDIVKNDEAMKKNEKKTPWNIDTISEPGFTKTVINTKPVQEEKVAKMKKFIQENGKLLKQYSMLQRYSDSKQFLQEHSSLICEETAEYLLIWCLKLAIEDKYDLIPHVAHQAICMQYILELAKQLDFDPRGCISSFFSRIQVAEQSYKVSFDGELTKFVERIKKHAEVKMQETLQKQEEEEKKARLGPGGLDPVDVYEELPDEMKKCFDNLDCSMLQATISKMPEEEAVYFMKRCVDSGLWVPDNNDDDDTAANSTNAPGATAQSAAAVTSSAKTD